MTLVCPVVSVINRSSASVSKIKYPEKKKSMLVKLSHLNSKAISGIAIFHIYCAVSSSGCLTVLSVCF